MLHHARMHTNKRKTLEQYWLRSHFLSSFAHELLQGEEWILFWGLVVLAVNQPPGRAGGFFSSGSRLSVKALFIKFCLTFSPVFLFQSSVTWRQIRCVSAAPDSCWKLNVSRSWLDSGHGGERRSSVVGAWSRNSWEKFQRVFLTMAISSQCREIRLGKLVAKHLTPFIHKSKARQSLGFNIAWGRWLRKMSQKDIRNKEGKKQWKKVESQWLGGQARVFIQGTQLSTNDQI